MRDGRITADYDPDEGHACEPMPKVTSVARGLKRKMVGYVAHDGATPRQAFSKVTKLDAPNAAVEEELEYGQLDLQVPCRRRVRRYGIH